MGDDMMIVAPRILPETTQELPWRTAAEGVVLMTGLAISQEVRLAMPEGYTVEELPDGWTQQQPSASGTLSYEVEGREIVYRCRVSQRGGIYAKPEYNVLRLFLQELAQAARRPVILKRTQAATQ